VSLIVKYSNWMVSLLLLVIGFRVLFVIFPWTSHSIDVWRDRPWVPLGQSVMAVLFILAAVGTVRWENWGRSLGVVICAWNAFATLFLTRLGPHRLAGLSFCAVLVLLVVWFKLPKIKLQFARPL
jgi:hypothetical protein